MDIERSEYGNEINYHLNVIGERYCINTWGTKVNDHLIIMGSEGISRGNVPPQILAVYDIIPGMDFDNVILSNFEKYVKGFFSSSLVHEKIFSQSLDKFKVVQE